MTNKIPKAVFSLKRFILRQQVLKLYREYMILLKQVEEEGHRKELRDWIRSDFKQNKHHTEEEVIKMHLSRGRNSLKRLENTVTLPRAIPRT